MGAFGGVSIRAGVAEKTHSHSAPDNVPYDFVREVAALSFLHEGVLSDLQSWSRDPETGSCVSRYVSATTDLFRYINDRAAFSARARSRARGDLMRGVSYLHRTGFMHRDIKPSNVLVFVSGDRARLKLADFGTCVPLVEGRSYTLNVGTPCYAAPETTTTDAYDHRVDWYSTGLVLHEMLVWRTPSNPADRTFLQRTNEQRLVHAMVDEDPDARWSASGARDLAPAPAGCGWPRGCVEVNDKMRSILFDWLGELNHGFQQQGRTLAHARNLVDAYVSVRPGVARARLQLVGCAATALASKLWETRLPVDADYVVLSAQSFAVEDLAAAQLELLGALGGNLYGHW